MHEKPLHVFVVHYQQTAIAFRRVEPTVSAQTKEINTVMIVARAKIHRGGRISAHIRERAGSGIQRITEPIQHGCRVAGRHGNGICHGFCDGTEIERAGASQRHWRRLRRRERGVATATTLQTHEAQCGKSQATLKQCATSRIGLHAFDDVVKVLITLDIADGFAVCCVTHSYCSVSNVPLGN